MLENSYPIRTDLALESQERLQEDQADMRDIRKPGLFYLHLCRFELGAR